MSVFSLPTRLRRSQRGFTLVEMLTVAALIAILSTVAIASIQQSRAIAVEAAAIGAGKTLANAEYQYFSRYREFGSFGQLQAERDLIDVRYDSGDDITTTHDSPIAPYYSVSISPRADTFRISLTPIPGSPFNLRQFVADSDGSISQISGSSILPIGGLSGS